MENDHTPTTTRPGSSRPNTGFAALVTAFAVGALVGCVGPAPIDAVESPLFESEAIPLGMIGGDDLWMEAPAGCEDRLEVGHSFLVASAPDSLIAARDDATGEIVCVDSLESVQTELEDEGREDDAQELAQRFMFTLFGLDGEDLWDDPSPQPSTEVDTDPDVGQGVDGADPSPQPS